MKCASIRLQERSKLRYNLGRSPSTEKPRRYCQKRMVNPDHEEDPRWTDVLQRFYCNLNTDVKLKETLDQVQIRGDDLVLTVQTLKFEGDVQKTKRPKTSFKYKTLTDGNKHRMFVKQIVDEHFDVEDRSSQLTCYYIDDYMKYIHNADRSRPSSGKSSIFLYNLNKLKENKSTQVDVTETGSKKPHKTESKSKNIVKVNPKNVLESDETKKESNSMEDAKIAFRVSGKRKSLTISRTQSPETVQVIRVDVVCNNNNSSTLSDFEETKNQTTSNIISVADKKLNVRSSHFADKYLLTNTIKTLDENVSGGAKVTLLCKTFKLSQRLKVDPEKKSSSVKVRNNKNRKNV